MESVRRSAARFADDDHPRHDLLDFVGIGFGPSNLSLAVAVQERNEQVGGPLIRAAFLERQPRFGWHLGMMIEGATMQVAFLKDLATMRDPRSRFTFVNYLFEHGRLAHFINQKDFFPTRSEFHDYLTWVADGVRNLVGYDREVTRIRPVNAEGTVTMFEIESRHATTRAAAAPLRAHNVVLATGMTPRMPVGTALSDRVWHTSELMSKVGSLRAAPPRSIAVVGSGQSAAEATAYLHERFDTATVYCVMQRYGYSAADNTPFANRVFDPDAVDDYYTATAEGRRQIFQYHANTNYSVVDEHLISDLYKRVYGELVAGRPRLLMYPMRQLTGITAADDGRPVLDLASRQTFACERLAVDLVVLATGYTQMDPTDLLPDIAGACLRDANGRLRISRSYQVLTTDAVHAGIYVQGGSEHTHGLSSSLLSNVAVRAGEILSSMIDLPVSQNAR
jgi:L-ornithine N5-oxygenase